MRRRLAVVIFVSGMLATTAWSQTLPLPPNLISADSAAGECFFFESEAREAYFPPREPLCHAEASVLLWRREHRHGAECSSNYRAGGP